MTAINTGKQTPSTAFIAVFRPHQRPAWAQVFENEQAFIDAWANGDFDCSCHANGDSLTEDERELTFANAWSDVAHDLHALTRLDSAEDVASYVANSDYYGHHNKALRDVRRCAEELGWIVEGDE